MFYFAIFKKEKWYKNLVLKISQKLSLPVKYFDFDNKTSVEEWLSFIKCADFVITDSFHGFVFSLIFNRPFLQIKNAKAQSRFDSMFRLLEIEDNSISKESKLDFDKIFVERDWKKINKKIDEEVKKAEQWMKQAFELPTKDNSEYEIENFLLINSQLQKTENKKLLNIYKNRRTIYINYNFYKICKLFSCRRKKENLSEKIPAYKEMISRIN